MPPPPQGRLKITTPLWVVYGLWAIVLMDPHVFVVAKTGLTPLFKLPLLMFGSLGLLTLSKGKWPSLAPYLLGYMLVGVVAMPGAFNRGLADTVVKMLIMFYIFTLGTITFARRPQQVIPVIALILFQFAWWGFHGALTGRAGWHSTNANYDGFGPQMVIGLAVCYYFGMAAKAARVKLVANLLAGVCIIGIITSFARGAVLSTGLVAFILWLRSPKKGRATVAMIAASIILVVGVQVIFPDGSFWDEMASSFTEGTERGTGSDRKVLWTAAVKVFVARPLVGTAPDNFGPFAAQYFEVGEVGGAYGDNPRRLYTRQLHSIFFQVLAESGALGSFFFIMILVDFWRKNQALRTRAFGRAWRAGDRNFELKPLALGLESALVAYLASGFFYDQLYVPWLYWITAANMMLYYATKSQVKTLRTPTPAVVGAPRRS